MSTSNLPLSPKPPKRNKAIIEREDLSGHAAKEESKAHMKAAGEALKPFAHDLQASVMVHFYKARNQELYAFIVHQAGVRDIPEPQADAGTKELIRTMMSVYGRTPPKTRTDV